MQRRRYGAAGSPALQRGAERIRASRATWIRSSRSTSGNRRRAAAEAMASARGRCSSTRASRALRAERLRAGAGWRRPEEVREAIGGRRRTPPPPAGRSAEARTPDAGGRLARSLTRREDWPRDAVGVRRPGGDPLPSDARTRGTSEASLPRAAMAMLVPQTSDERGPQPPALRKEAMPPARDPGLDLAARPDAR
jgi:hypothetical protein